MSQRVHTGRGGNHRWKVQREFWIAESNRWINVHAAHRDLQACAVIGEYRPETHLAARSGSSWDCDQRRQAMLDAMKACVVENRARIRKQGRNSFRGVERTATANSDHDFRFALPSMTCRLGYQSRARVRLHFIVDFAVDSCCREKIEN